MSPVYYIFEIYLSSCGWRCDTVAVLLDLGAETALLGFRYDQGLGSNQYANLMRKSFQLSCTVCFPVALLLVPLLQNRYH